MTLRWSLHSLICFLEICHKRDNYLFKARKVTTYFYFFYKKFNYPFTCIWVDLVVLSLHLIFLNLLSHIFVDICRFIHCSFFFYCSWDICSNERQIWKITHDPIFSEAPSCWDPWHPKKKKKVVGILICVSARVRACHDLLKKRVAYLYLIQDTQTLRNDPVRVLTWLMKKK